MGTTSEYFHSLGARSKQLVPSATWCSRRAATCPLKSARTSSRRINPLARRVGLTIATAAIDATTAAAAPTTATSPDASTSRLPLDRLRDFVLADPGLADVEPNRMPGHHKVAGHGRSSRRCRQYLVLRRSRSRGGARTLLCAALRSYRAQRRSSEPAASRRTLQPGERACAATRQAPRDPVLCTRSDDRTRAPTGCRDFPSPRGKPSKLSLRQIRLAHRA